MIGRLSAVGGDDGVALDILSKLANRVVAIRRMSTLRIDVRLGTVSQVPRELSRWTQVAV